MTLPARRASRPEAHDESWISGQTIRERDDRIVCAHVAIDRDAVETLHDCGFKRALENVRFDSHIRGNEGKHCRMKTGRRSRTVPAHSRLNHSRAFTDAADANGRPSQF